MQLSSRHPLPFFGVPAGDDDDRGLVGLGSCRGLEGWPASAMATGVNGCAVTSAQPSPPRLRVLTTTRLVYTCTIPLPSTKRKPLPIRSSSASRGEARIPPPSANPAKSKRPQPGKRRRPCHHARHVDPPHLTFRPGALRFSCSRSVAASHSVARACGAGGDSSSSSLLLAFFSAAAAAAASGCIDAWGLSNCCWLGICWSCGVRWVMLAMAGSR